MFASEEREMRQEWRQRPLEAEVRPAAEPELARGVAMERTTDAQYEVEADSDTAPEDGVNTEDDFAEAEEGQRERDPELVPVAASVFDDDFFRRSQLAPAGEQAAVAGVPMASASQTEGSETDELDIPAFLRRSH